MTLQKLASTIAKREAGKSQVAIGNVREVLKVLATLEAEAMLIAEGGGDVDMPIDQLVQYAEKIKGQLKRKLKVRGKK